MSQRTADRPGILFLVPSLCRAGAEMQVVSLANALDRTVFRKHLLSYMENLDQYARIAQEEVDFYHTPRKGRFDLHLIRTISRIIDLKEIDLIHCTMQHALLIGWLAKHFSKRKPRLVAAIHTTINESLIGELSDRWLYSRILCKCDKIVFVCQKQKTFWTERYPSIEKNSTVIYNGVDTAYFNSSKFVAKGMQLRIELGIPEKATVVCCIASFRPEKSHDILIEAFSKLDPSCYLLLAGDGEKKCQTQQIVKSKNLQDRVKFLGVLPDVRPVLAASDVSVLASTSVETFSMAMLESMSMGVPMVATDIGGLSEAINPGETGMLVKVGDAGDLAQGIEAVIHDSRKLDIMRKNCRKVVLEMFSERAMISITEQIINGVILQSSAKNQRGFRPC